MLPAPRQTTRSPGRAISAISGARSSGPSIGRTSRCPCRRTPSTRASRLDALDRRLAGGVDRRHQHRVGVVEAGAEILEQAGEAGVAMRLHDGDHAAGGAGARGAQHGLDLDRVVAIVVDDADPVDRAGTGEAALDALQARQRAADHLVGDAQLARDHDRGQGVGDVVQARQRELHPLQPALALAVLRADHDVEHLAVGLGHRGQGAHIGLRAEAVGHDAPIGHPAVESLDLGMVDAQGGEAVERHALDEGVEGIAQRIEAAVDAPCARGRCWSPRRWWPASAGSCRRSRRPRPRSSRPGPGAHWCRRR